MNENLVRERHAQERIKVLERALRLSIEYGSFPQGSGVLHDLKAALGEHSAREFAPPSNDCCGRTMVLGYRCEGCPYAKPGDKLVPRRPQDPNPSPESGDAVPSTDETK